MPMPPTPCAITLVTTTVATSEDARRLAQGAVRARLAACVQVEAITSHYVWQGSECEDAEWRLVCKTLPTALPALLRWLRDQHPYDVPQLLAQEAQAQPDYAEWLAGQVRA
ncbi:divalent cation tolerance protein [Oryzisolibacter propanilivorax]|uniref:Divalent cation tolerance protein n=1 Tax=Oryzisolibacter propanilivorax TaxID=1527607 RepID=A0A1G9RJX1_9BURK|nr:divalent cation tolerance protein [Oryzisolibacter propanilivorax]